MIFPRYSELKKLSPGGLFDLGVATALGAILALVLSPILVPLWVAQRLAGGMK